MERRRSDWQPSLQGVVPADPAPLRCCLLSGGASRRMGRDKALLPHPEGGSWLERSLRLLAGLQAPITLLSRWPEHLALAAGLGTELGSQPLELLHEPAPQEGPLLALHRLMERHPGERLLLCPVDMPQLTQDALQQLLAASAAAPSVIQLAHDGERCQPLLAVLPAHAALLKHLTRSVSQGERQLQRWLMKHPWHAVGLNPHSLRNCNRPEEIPTHHPSEPGSFTSESCTSIEHRQPDRGHPS